MADNELRPGWTRVTTEWCVLWSNGLDDVFEDEAEAREWAARFPQESSTLHARTITSTASDWAPVDAS